ncbi:GGDEF domain-containing protein [Novispirillum sp. DQ9]|uniref:GGDEF domain-containing protein n=1 Tax=Novispirillum sp. DQ9 TaxID=3398612 RepID=UPI003C7D6E49
MRLPADLPLRLKARLALLGVLVLFMVFGAVALERMSALHHAATAVGRTALPLVRLAGEVDTLASAYRAAEADALLAEDGPARATAVARLAEVRARLDQRLADAAGEDAALAQAVADWPDYVAGSEAVLALLAEGRRDAAIAAFRAAAPRHAALGEALGALQAAGEAAQAAARADIARAAEQTRWMMLSIGTGLMIIGVALVLLFEASLVAFARRLQVALKRGAAGEPHAPMPHVEHDDEFGDLARAVRSFVAGMDSQRRREMELRAQAGTDELTRVANRRAFLERADDEISRALRYGHTLSLLMVDIDHFKQVNDAHGHAAGDAALVRMVDACRPGLREHDVLARLGGEEFVVLLPHTDAARALLVAERLREAVERSPVETAAGIFHITISIGSATLHHGDATGAPADSLSSLLERADKALYRAKRGGRNRVVGGALPAA